MDDIYTILRFKIYEEIRPIYFSADFSLSFINMATASDVTYGLAQKKVYATAQGITASAIQVPVYNYTGDYYTLNATFYTNAMQPVQSINGFLIYPYGYPQAIVTYTISPPATYVCVSSIRQFDGYVLSPPACAGNGSAISISNPYLQASANSAAKALPTMAVRKQ